MNRHLNALLEDIEMDLYEMDELYEGNFSNINGFLIENRKNLVGRGSKKNFDDAKENRETRIAIDDDNLKSRRLQDLEDSRLEMMSRARQNGSNIKTIDDAFNAHIKKKIKGEGAVNNKLKPMQNASNSNIKNFSANGTPSVGTLASQAKQISAKLKDPKTDPKTKNKLRALLYKIMFKIGKITKNITMMKRYNRKYKAITGTYIEVISQYNELKNKGKPK
jgi:hypothetical protein